MVPEKSAKTWVTPVETMEERAEAEGKSIARNASPAQDGKDALTSLRWIGKRAKEEPKEKFTNLLSHVKAPLLKEAFHRLRKEAAPGVDGVTWIEYADRLDERLLDLQDRVHRGSYHPQPVRRVHIPKGDGGTRPLGVPSLEDKIVQQAVRMVLEPIYEAMFVGFSYGFRPGRSQHDALDALAEAIARKVNWVLDADIRSFFDTIDHGWMQRFIEHRIGDRRITHIAGTSQRGAFQLLRHTSRKKRRAKLARLKEDCERRRHRPVPEQHAWLGRVLRGHVNYDGVPTNERALHGFCNAVKTMWHRSLQRRGQRRRWTIRVERRHEHRFPLPRPTIVHPWPEARFASR